MKRETFDEHTVRVPNGHIRLQFFEPRLWQWRIKAKISRDRAQPNLAGWPRMGLLSMRPVLNLYTGWVVALPFLSVRYVRGLG